MDSLLAFIFTYRGALVPLVLIPAVVIPPGPHGSVRYFTGLGLLLLGVCFRVSGVRQIGGRARIHSAGARNLATNGVFGHVRNPLYIGNTLYAAGLGALYFSLLGAALAALYLLVLYMLIALHEERALELQLGAACRRYLSSVPRWLFKLKPFTNHDASSSVVPFREVLRWERHFLFTGFLMALLAAFGHSGWLPFRLPDELLSHRHLACAGTGVALLVSFLLFLRIALRINRKRGSWLAVDRITTRT